MKRLCGLVMLSALLAVAVSTWAATLTVPDDYPTIQAAIDTAQPGDTVYVKAGRYVENLTITKPLHLVGEDRTTVIIQSPDAKKDVITVNLAQGEVKIEGIEVSEGDTGINVDVNTGAQVDLTGIIVYRNKYGVAVFGNGMLVITTSYLIDNDAINLLLENASAVARKNEILRGGIGILLISPNNLTLADNLIGLCERGIDTYTNHCGWKDGATIFTGAVNGTGNRIYGLKTNLCPEYPGSPWPDGFVDQKWGKAIAAAVAAYNRAVDSYNAQDYTGALTEYTAGLALLKNAPFPLLEAYFNQNIGVVYDELGLYEDALAAYKSARAVYASHQMDVDVATIDTNIGNVYAKLGRYDDALAAYKSARVVYVSHQMDVTVANIDQNIGVVYYDLGRYDDALAAYKSARAVYVSHGMDVDVAKIDMNIGVVYKNLGQYEDALAAYKSARAVHLSHGMDVDVADVDTNIGNVYYDLGRYEDALAAYNSAHAVYASHQMDVDVADVGTNIGAVYYELGRYEDALAAYNSARAVYASHQMDVDVAKIDQNIGVVYWRLGRYEDALTAYKSARAVFVNHHMDVGVAKIDMNIGNVYWKLGQYTDAIVSFRTARAVFLSHNMDVDVAKIDTNIGNVYDDLGLYDDALTAYQSVRAVFVSHQMDVDVAKIDMNIGVVYYDLGRYKDALAAFQSALVVYVSHHMEVNVAKIDQNIGIMYYDLGHYEDALASYQEALSILGKIPPAAGMEYSYPATRWKLYSAIGIAHEARKEWKEAQSAYEDSIAVIESLRGYMKSEEIKTAWQQRTQDVYERLIKLLIEHGQGVSAFPYAERCRARTFLDALYQGSVAPNQLISPEAGISSGAVDPKAIDQAVANARDSLQPNEAVLEYMVTDTGVYLWVITKEGISDPIFIKYERAQLMNDVITLRKSLEREPPDQITMTERLTSFYDKLVKEGLSKLPDGVDTLILIPSGPLWYLPFSALQVFDQEEGTTRYLIERYTIAYLPSLASLPSLTREREETQVAGGPVLALADPEVSEQQLQEGASSKCVIKPLPRYPGLVEAAQAFADELLGGNTGEESVYAGKEAEETIAYAVAGNRVEVYAAHGQFNPKVPLQSKLLLAPSESGTAVQTDSREPDGNYHAWEALLTDHRGTELVVLAACESLLPHLGEMQGTMAVLGDKECSEVKLTSKQLEQIVVGDEVVGLARAFLSSGAEAVLGTLWRANSTAIGKLLTSMADYHNKGNTWAQALTKAQRDLIKGNAFTNPWFWAPYQLVGRWR